MLNNYKIITNMIKNTLLILILTITSLAEAADDVNQYINQLVDKAQIILGDSKSTNDDKITKSRDLISTNLDIDWMAKYTLGRYRKSLSESEIKEFTETYSKYVINTFVELIKNYKGEKTEIKNVEKLDDKDFVVRTEVIKPNGQPGIKVDYMVRNLKTDDKDNFKIFDIVTEGISMINSQKSEFGNMLTNSNLGTLISSLKKKL